MKVKYINSSQLLEIVHTNRIDFICKCITPWHAISVKAFILYLLEKEKCCKGIVLIDIINNKYMLRAEDFIGFNNIEVYYLQQKEIESFRIKFKLFVLELLYKVPSKTALNKIYLSSPWHIPLSMGLRLKIENPVYCRTDEGIGTYEKESFSFIYKVLNFLNKKPVIINSLIAYIRLINLRRIENSVGIIDFTLLSFSRDKKLKINRKTLPYYNKALSKTKVNFNINYCMFENAVIICTYPQIKELDHIEKSLIDIIRRIIKLGYNVIIKPHPRETDIRKRYESLKCIILDNLPCSLELLVDKVKDRHIKAVISFNSSASVYISALYGIKGIFLNCMEELSPDDLKRCLNYNYKFLDLIFCPRNFEELIHILNS